MENRYQVCLKIYRYIFKLKAKEVADYVGISSQYLSEIENLKKPLSKTLELAFHYLYEDKYSSILYKKHVGLPEPIFLCNRLDRMKYEDLLLTNKYIDKRKKFKDFNIGNVITICDSTVIGYTYKGKYIRKHKENKGE